MSSSTHSDRAASVLEAFHLSDQAVDSILSEFIAVMELSQPEEAEKVRAFSLRHTALAKRVVEDAIMDATLCAILENDDDFESCVKVMENRKYLADSEAFSLYGKMFWASVMEREGSVRVVFPGTQEETLKRRAQFMSSRLNVKKHNSKG